MAEVKLGKLPGQPNKQVEVKTIVEAAEMQRAPMGQRLFHAFFMVDSPKQIMENLMFKVLVPSIKQLTENLFNRGIHMLFFGEDSAASTAITGSDKSFVSYGSFYSGQQPPKQADQALKVRTLTDFDMPIIKPTKEKPDAEAAANEVLAQMRDLISLRAPNGWATVSEFYQSVSRTPEWTDAYYGWYDLSTAKVVPVENGWFLVQMPKAVILQ